MGENKCLDQGTVLINGGEDEAGGKIPFFVPVGSPGTTDPNPWFPGVGIQLSGGFLLPWKLKDVSPSFTSSLQYNPGL